MKKLKSDIDIVDIQAFFIYEFVKDTLLKFCKNKGFDEVTTTNLLNHVNENIYLAQQTFAIAGKQGHTLQKTANASINTFYAMYFKEWEKPSKDKLIKSLKILKKSYEDAISDKGTKTPNSTKQLADTKTHTTNSDNGSKKR